ncbi:7060_t:CDS:2 [Entrophospora sp. SA101]|nr:7060_t:CDS:2 [Entrophospora sp. SA101]
MADHHPESNGIHIEAHQQQIIPQQHQQQQIIPQAQQHVNGISTVPQHHNNESYASNPYITPQNDEVRQSMNKRKATDISNNLIKQHKGYYEKTNTRYENLIKYLYSSNETVKMEMKTIQKNQILLKRELEISLSELENKKTHLKSLQEGYITQKSLLSIQKNQYELLDERFKRQNKKECEKINELQKDNVKILEEIERLKTYRESEGQSSSSDFLENENKNLQSQVYLLKAQCKLNEQRLKMPKELIKRHESTLRLLIDHKKIVSENNVQDKNLPIY